MSSKDCKGFYQTDPKENIGHSDTTSLRYANALERFESEYQTMASDRMSESQVYQTSPKYSSPIKDSDSEVVEIDMRNNFPLCQDNILEEIPNLPVKCCDSSEESSELKRKDQHEGSVTLSDVGRCIRNACDTLLGMDPSDTDHVLETTNSQFMDLISSDSKQQASFSEAELLDGNVENKSESKREKLEPEKNQFIQDSSLSRSLCCNSSETSPEEPDFNTYRIHEQYLSEKDNKVDGKKIFQCDFCQRIFIYKCNLHLHLRTHTGEKPFQCEVCQRRFTQKSNLLTHMRTHTGVKPFQCEVCQRRFTQKVNLLIHMRTHNSENHSIVKYDSDIA